MKILVLQFLQATYNRHDTIGVAYFIYFSLLFSFSLCQSCKFQDSNMSCICDIRENASINSIVAVVPNNAGETFNEDYADSSETIRVHENRSVELLKKLIWNVDSPNTFTIFPSIGSKSITLLFQVIDTDDNSPVWSSSHYTINIPEGEKIPYLLKNIQPQIPIANDKDSDSAFVQIIYETILPGFYSDYLLLGNNRTRNMNISLVKPLDYEKTQSFNVTLQAQDYSAEQNKVIYWVNATLTVNVVDIDDNPPKWVNCSSPCKYTASIFDNSTTGSKIPVDIKAVDGDTYLNETLVYSIAIENEFVNINSETGELTLKSNNPEPKTYEVLIQAYQKDDNKMKSDVAQVIITVFPAAYKAPWFDEPNKTISIDENHESWSLIVTAKAQVGTALKYSMEEGNSKFVINENTGELKLKQALDYENATKHFIIISASDGKSKGYSYITVNVTNMNDNNPKFSQESYKFKINSRETNTLVGKVTATDPDGDTVEYSHQVNEKQYFSVNKVTGEIRIATSANTLVEQTYTYTIVASDESRKTPVLVEIVFPNSLTQVATASTSPIPFIGIGAACLVIVIIAIVLFVVYKRRSDKDMERALSVVSGPGFSNYYDGSIYGEGGATSLQENPIEGFDPYDDDGYNDMSTFHTNRQISELYLNDAFVGETTDGSSVMNGSIRTLSSAAGSQRTLLNGSTTKQLHTDSNLEVVQMENAVDTGIDDLGSKNKIPGLTVYL